MGKYIWPNNAKEAVNWYLRLLRQLGRGVNLDEFLGALATDPDLRFKPTRRQLQKQLYRLHKSGLVAKRGAYSDANYSITRQGIKHLEEMTFIDYKAPPLPSSWDNRWRLVLFDIPEELREARYHVRRLLKELGFKQLQLSVWIHFLPYTEAFQSIQIAYGASAHIIIVEAVDFTPPNAIVKHFHEKYPKLI